MGLGECNLRKLMNPLSRLTRSNIAFGVLSTVALVTSPLQASDHQEAPATQAQLVADIGDYYAWHEGDNLNLVLTFGTFAAPGTPASYDSNILYSLHFDTTADGVSDLDINARFAQDTSGNWGVQIMGVGEAPLEGAVETMLSNDDLTAWAGLADDPFFFDQTGFRETVATGTLSFDPTRDDVAGLNVTTLVVQVPIDAILSGGGAFQTWATTNSL